MTVSGWPRTDPKDIGREDDGKDNNVIVFSNYGDDNGDKHFDGDDGEDDSNNRLDSGNDSFDGDAVDNVLVDNSSQY